MNWVAFKIETNGKEISDPLFKVIMICISDGIKPKLYSKYHLDKAMQVLTSDLILVGNNCLAFDRQVFAKFGFTVQAHDILLMNYCLTGELKVPEMLDCSETDNWDDNDPEWRILANKCAADCEQIRLDAERLSAALKEEDLWEVYKDNVMPAAFVLNIIPLTERQNIVKCIERLSNVY